MPKTSKKFYITERHNPQFKKPYYVKHGQLSKAEAKRKENAVYGTNYVKPYDTEAEYNAALEQIKADGFSIH